LQGTSDLTGISDDGLWAVVSTARRDNEKFQESLAIYDASLWQPTGTVIRLQELQRCYSVEFLKELPIVVGVVYTNATATDFRTSQVHLKFWNVSDGSESWALAMNPDERVMNLCQTPDGRALMVVTISNKQTNGRLLRIDLTSHEVQVLFDEPRRSPRSCVIDPSGKWMVVPVLEFPQSTVAQDIPLDDLPQPRLQIREVATGSLLEELIAPPGYMISLAFSPDGKTLATSGNGGVLLWDFTDPPGKASPAVVGRPFVATGTLAGGKPLDWDAFRNKVVLVTFWATWCAPCVAEIPETKKTFAALHDRGFEVLAVSLDDDLQVLERFLKTHEVPWPVVCGTSGDSAGRQHPLARKYGVESIPKSFLIDRQGNIAVIDPSAAELEKLAEKLLKQDSETGESK
jgi:peroxiredoxin